jgi:hypothetical protein
LAPHGKNNATTDIDTILRWFRKEPNLNIATPTGREFGIAVLDVDPRHGGWESIDDLEERYGPLPATHAVETGGGGLHVYLEYPHDHEIRTSTSLVGAGLDIRANGGSIILPPSLHASGKKYAWATVVDADSEMGPDEGLAQMPAWLIALATKPTTAVAQDRSFPTSALKGTGTREPSSGPIPDGQRNATLASRAGALRRLGFTQSEILATLLQMNAERCTPPLPDMEVYRIAQSVARYAPSPVIGKSGGAFAGITIRAGKVVAP